MTDPACVTVIDAGFGSVQALVRQFARVGAPVCVAQHPTEIAQATGIVLPGVGHFTTAWERLVGAGWVPALQDHHAQGRPLLGVCLGMHLLFSGSDEGPGPGLGFLPGRIVALPATPRSHHIGWATPTWATSAPPFARAPGHRFAFAHGFACPADHPATAATLAVQGRDWAMAVHAGNLIGVQFHPEKSLDAGARLCADFARWCGHDLIDLPWDA